MESRALCEGTMQFPLPNLDKESSQGPPVSFYPEKETRLDGVGQ